MENSELDFQDHNAKKQDFVRTYEKQKQSKCSCKTHYYL